MLALSLNSTSRMVPQECILGSHNSAITDIAWAPSMGRSYHMIATASRESSFKVRTVAFFLHIHRSHQSCFYHNAVSIISQSTIRLIYALIYLPYLKYAFTSDPQIKAERQQSIRIHLKQRARRRRPSIQRVQGRLECHRDSTSDLRRGWHTQSMEEELQWGVGQCAEHRIGATNEDELFSSKHLMLL
jgi:hypothetical protein